MHIQLYGNALKLETTSRTMRPRFCWHSPSCERTYRWSGCCRAVGLPGWSDV